MYCIGCIQVLVINVMAETGMVDIQSMPYSSVLKMLSQKKFPDNVTVPRMLADDVLHLAFGNNNLREVLDDLSNKAKIAYVGIDSDKTYKQVQ